jgi:hypothetical protein
MKRFLPALLLVLLASCTTQEDRTRARGSIITSSNSDTLRRKPVTSPAIASRSEHKLSRYDRLPGEYRNYGLVEEPDPIAALDVRPIHRPSMYLERRSNGPDRTVINNVTNSPLPNAPADSPRYEVTPTGANRDLINQVTNQPVHQAVVAGPASGTYQTVINEVNNQPLNRGEVPVSAETARKGVNRTVIDPITNRPLQ